MNTATDGGFVRERYDATARLLHWLVAGMIVLQYVLAKMAEAADEDGSKFRELVLLANHKSVGLTILAVAALRLGWRFFHQPPPALPMPQWQRMAAGFSHGAFYGLMFIMPITGWLMSSAANISVSWFNLFQLPDFVGPNDDLESQFESVHEFLAKVLIVLALVHVGAALKHTFFDRDEALRRISSPLGVAAFVLVIIAGVMLLSPASRAQEAEPSLWDINYEASSIHFTAEQAGASFDGEWQSWKGELRFDRAALDSSAFDVAVEVASVATLDEERDETLQDPEFFDGVNFPLAHYRATRFEKSGDSDSGYVANGLLEIKGSSSPVPLRFTVQQDGASVVLDGTARLDRLVIGVGTGDWEDTTWVGQFVDVTVHVEATVEE